MPVEPLVWARDDLGGETDFLDAELIGRCGPAVCRIIRKAGPKTLPHATGFLVGPALVLTCWHVAKFFGQPGYDYACEFPALGAEEPPDPVKVERILVSSQAAPGERQADDDGVNPPGVVTHATSQYLDFVLLKLVATADGASAEDLPDGRAFARGWLTLASQPKKRPAPESGGPPRVRCQIIQHPNSDNGGGGQKAATGALRATWVEDGREVRLCYDTASANGTSGSPVFDDDKTVIAMHQARLPRYAIGEVEERLGQGVPMWLIMEEIAKQATASPDLAAAWAQKKRADEEWLRFRTREERRIDDVPRPVRVALNDIIFESMDRDAEKADIVRAFGVYMTARDLAFVQIMGRTNDDMIPAFVKRAIRLLLICTQEGGNVNEYDNYIRLIDSEFYHNPPYGATKILKLDFPKDVGNGGQIDYFITTLKERLSESDYQDGSPFICIASAKYRLNEAGNLNAELVENIMSSIAQELHEAGVTPLPLVVVVQTLADDQRELARQHYENWIPCAPKANLLQAGIRLETVRPGSLQDWLQIIDDVFCRFKDYDPTSIRDIHENLPDEAVEISKLYYEFKAPIRKLLKLA